MLSRDQALDLIKAQNPEPHMINHALQSEAVMRALAKRLGKDADLWGLTGLVHDLDYPMTKDNPSRHGLDALDILGDGLPPEALHAISAHNEECTGVAAENDFDYALRAAETVTGLISAAALVRPTRMEGMAPKGLKKKMKDKSFAAAVSRERIMECERLGLELGDFLLVAIPAMTAVAQETGIA
ncbi:HD domain-containing protein [Desulfocurvus sp. DL9XJH121]